MKPSEARIEPIMYLLFAGMLIFTGILLWIAQARPNDGQTFQVIAGLLTAFSGSFFTRLKPRNPEDTPPSKTTTTIDKDAGRLVQETQVGQVPKPPEP